MFLFIQKTMQDLRLVFIKYKRMAEINNHKYCRLCLTRPFETVWCLVVVCWLSNFFCFFHQTLELIGIQADWLLPASKLSTTWLSTSTLPASSSTVRNSASVYLFLWHEVSRFPWQEDEEPPPCPPPPLLCPPPLPPWPPPLPWPPLMPPP